MQETGETAPLTVSLLARL